MSASSTLCDKMFKFSVTYVLIFPFIEFS
uniref:Uncharacterized protein n=1 Tax=Rhizophora mucronata TaxID=61149 RepID=A0A2P2JVR5_RHIMU